MLNYYFLITSLEKGLNVPKLQLGYGATKPIHWLYQGILFTGGRESRQPTVGLAVYYLPKIFIISTTTSSTVDGQLLKQYSPLSNG